MNKQEIVVAVRLPTCSVFSVKTLKFRKCEIPHMESARARVSPYWIYGGTAAGIYHLRLLRDRRSGRLGQKAVLPPTRCSVLICDMQMR